MVTLEQVEKLCERADISYDEAKVALEATNGDLLEAIINLEKQGRVKAPSGGYYKSENSYTTADKSNYEKTQKEEYSRENGSTFSEILGKFLKWSGKIFHKGNINTFEVSKNGNKIVIIPVTVLILLLIFTFWITVPIIIIGLFFGYRYVFNGPDLEKTSVNVAMNSVSNAAENLIKEVNEHKGGKNNGEDSNN